MQQSRVSQDRRLLSKRHLGSPEVSKLIGGSAENHKVQVLRGQGTAISNGTD